MALSQSSLKTAIKSVLDSYPSDTSDAASGLTDAYVSYLSSGQFGSSVFGPLTALETALESALNTTLSSTRTLAGFANAWQTGLTALIGLPVTGAQSGTVTAAPAVLALAANIEALLESYPSSTDDGADRLAGALHTATASCVATVSPPPGTLLTIT